LPLAERHLQFPFERCAIFNCLCAEKSFFEFMHMEKVAVNAPDYKSRGVSSGNAIAAQRSNF
jgi:hypothetical protein